MAKKREKKTKKEKIVDIPKKFNVGTQKYEPDLEKLKEIKTDLKKSDSGKPDKTEKKVSKKEQIKNENKTLRNILIVIGIFVLGVVLVFAVLNSKNSKKSFEYEGLEFNKVVFCDAKPCLTTYQTALPVRIEGDLFSYNFYLRNDPRELDKDVSFEGKLNLLNDMVIDSEDSFNCEGYGIIAIKNLLTLYDVAGINTLKNETIGCSESGEYMFLMLKPGDETKIEQTGVSCYDIYINNCEILEGTERFMIETFVELSERFNF